MFGEVIDKGIGLVEVDRWDEEGKLLGRVGKRSKGCVVGGLN